MPIYEFYCATCHTLFNFLSRRVGVKSAPACPRCHGPLSREVSPFAHLKQRADPAAGNEADDAMGLDEARLEKMMAGMADQVEHLDDENADPRTIANVMRQAAHSGGMKFNPAVEEALARMERGEDPDALESEYGDALGAENPFVTDSTPGSSRWRDWMRRLTAGPRRDPTLYDL
jgi:putative FmdB family regulatory protein